eukprot:CAMPEP_0197026324 /NCGR_PEP_ID=MMETSP1384-20130603/6436_1 /TAXON_ID=29189 /ORGANISM="Ammonia sp." /LENGTH=355 /DNA_ID=CAMNT_0042454967 /DNA_START=30 /DNA_END=1097 /DNA_ORIENTATION=+
MAESASTQKNDGGKSDGKSMSEKLPDLFAKLQPFMEALVDLYAKMAPHIAVARKYLKQAWQKVEPFYNQYWKQEYIEIMIGVVLLFYGGVFAMTIACYMAVQLSGWNTIKESWRVLKTNYNRGYDAFRNDKQAIAFFDKDGSGEVDAKEIAEAAGKFFRGTAEEKKMILIHLKCVFREIDPQQVTNGLGGLWTTAIAVIATLRSSVAKDVALGVSMGEMASKQIGQYVKPMLRARFDDDLKQWADYLVDTVCRFLGISLALILVRVVSAFHSAVKGGQIIARFVCKFLSNKQLAPKNTEINVESTTFFIMMQYGLALMGFYWQLSSGFALNSWVLRLILLPFSICELILTWIAAY